MAERLKAAVLSAEGGSAFGGKTIRGKKNKEKE